MSRLVDATLTLLREKSACQQLENDEDDTEHDEIPMDAVSNLLHAIAKSLDLLSTPSTVESSWTAYTCRQHLFNSSEKVLVAVNDGQR
ncbi:hypothetical protein V6N12_069878 [Hibiscus sabdariffa]|uniref:Uncharacterized protein n=1 Tax=Hibiscus sabdariffa TaxID=183260 RepID=A0ABR2FF62_9ROSI